jgi:hypothetical protein
MSSPINAAALALSAMKTVSTPVAAQRISNSIPSSVNVSNPIPNIAALAVTTLGTQNATSVNTSIDPEKLIEAFDRADEEFNRSYKGLYTNYDIIHNSKYLYIKNITTFDNSIILRRTAYNNLLDFVKKTTSENQKKLVSDKIKNIYAKDVKILTEDLEYITKNYNKKGEKDTIQKTKHHIDILIRQYYPNLDSTQNKFSSILNDAELEVIKKIYDEALKLDENSITVKNFSQSPANATGALDKSIAAVGLATSPSDEHHKENAKSGTSTNSITALALAASDGNPNPTSPLSPPPQTIPIPSATSPQTGDPTSLAALTLSTLPGTNGNPNPTITPSSTPPPTTTPPTTTQQSYPDNSSLIDKQLKPLYNMIMSLKPQAPATPTP